MSIQNYENTVIDFVKKDGGLFIVASNDNSFASVLRTTVIKHLALDGACISAIIDEGKILKTIKEVSAKRKTVVLMMEQSFGGRETSFLVKQVKNAYANVKIIVLTSEVERQRLVLLHEIGADNIISKPISINNLIEKIAFTIRPHGKIGQIIEKGKECVANGSYGAALKIGAKILEIKPNSAAAFLIMGDAFKALGKGRQAVESYKAASANAPMYLEPLKKLAQYYYDTGDLQTHLKFLEQLDSLSPLNVERKVDMGGVHVELGNEEKAEELFDHAVKQARKEAVSYIEQITNRIAGIYGAKDPAKAETYYRKSLEISQGVRGKGDVKTYIKLGISLRKQGKWQEAVEVYENALRVAPDDGGVHYNMAMAFAEGKETHKAYLAMREALAKDPDIHANDPIVAYNIGLIFVRANKFEEGKEFLEHCVKLNPEHKGSLKLLAKLSS